MRAKPRTAPTAARSHREDEWEQRQSKRLACRFAVPQQEAGDYLQHADNQKAREQPGGRLKAESFERAIPVRGEPQKRPHLAPAGEEPPGMPKPSPATHAMIAAASTAPSIADGLRPEVEITRASSIRTLRKLNQW